ncbi:MAG: SGNH/GDSL hydrolase family protein [Pedosphaera sp.]|nr:SGNH/GDSL hydrolase family protein [Pedosphaera sp.]
MKKSVCIKLAFVICSTLICLFMLEITLRILGRHDEDGNRWFRWTRLKPYHLPVKRVTRMVGEYEAAHSRAAIIYDAELGWSPQPRHDGNNTPSFMLVSINVDRGQPKDRLRIALVGGSYTADSFESGWWRALENTLNAAGVKAEVLNFGVGGYSMDQSFLRWRKDVAAYHPHIVIFGFCRVYCDLNLNLLRMLKEPETGIPFMKPRFFVEGD